MKRLAGEEQASIYMRHGWTGAPKGKRRLAKDERLIDPAALSRDPNTSVRLADVSRDGMLLAYQVRQGGADEATVRIYNLAKKKPLEDELPAGIYYSVDFTPDGKGLYYARTNPKARCSICTSSAPATPTTSSSSATNSTASCSAPSISSAPRSPTTAATSSSPSSAAFPPSASTSSFAISPSPIRPSTFSSGASIRASPPSTPRAPGT